MDNVIYIRTKHSMKDIKYSKHSKFFKCSVVVPQFTGLQGTQFTNCLHMAKCNMAASFVSTVCLPDCPLGDSHCFRLRANGLLFLVIVLLTVGLAPSSRRLLSIIRLLVARVFIFGSALLCKQLEMCSG